MIALLTLGNAAHATVVSVADAQSVALNFYKVTNPQPSGASVTATLKYTKAEANGRVDFYVFDISSNAGFVIVAADDNVIPILAYSTSGAFNTNFAKTSVNYWINKTASDISLALQHNAQADTRIQSQWTAYRAGTNPLVQRSTPVAPLCTTTWDQEGYNPPPFLYNLYCPFNSTDNQRALTGCVATAMAQIMKYWNYPTTGTGSFTYVDNTANGYSNNYGIQSSNFAAHTYQWSQMPNILDGTEPAVQDTAVDLLMYDCAVSVGMDFGDDLQNGSGANGLIDEEIIYGDSFSSQYAFVKYFSYDADTILGVFDSLYTPSAWTALIEHDLNMGRPVLYEGNDTAQGGHAWVCDGYDASDKLHMNWGWSGQDNGYFAINNLTTSGNFNPIFQDDALIGILPKRSHPAGISTVAQASSFDMYPNPTTGEVMIKTSASGAAYTVRNLLGQTVLSGYTESEQTRLDLTSFDAGIYLVELRAGEKSVVKKLVVSR